MSTNSYYGSENGRFDTVVVESNNAIEAADVASTDLTIWFASAMILISVDLIKMQARSTFFTVDTTDLNTTKIQKLM